ncbi:MAG: protein translocase subunit SecF, partial [Thermodesulfovibrionia bacterium]|nr:protein translocase subunit SecF [Thermodesulfovibrionia bacterium]
MIEFIKNTKIDFMGKRFYAFGLSVLLMIIGFVTIIQVARGKANLGIDFAGGTAVQIKFNIFVQMQDIRTALIDAGITDFDLQDLPTENKILIKTKKGEETLGYFSKQIISVLSDKFSANNLVV